MKNLRDKAWIVMILFALIILLGICESVSAKEQNGTMLSEEAYQACEEIGEQYGICPELLMAIAETESSGRAVATRGDCKGLMQVSERWHKDRMKRLGVTDIYDEYGNILVATDYLLELFKEEEDVSIVLAKYNGDSRADEMAERGEISEYAGRILTRSAELERAHGK